MNNSLKSALWNFKACAEEAPEGCYDQAKAINEAIGDACGDLMTALRALGLKANASDLAFELEAAMYDYARKSNPEAAIFATAEGFGASMTRPERVRVLDQAVNNRDALRRLGL